MKIKLNCRHFPGDRPCRFHKETGVACDECPDYAPASHRILIIKLAALGDVLRTTAILPSLRSRYSGCHITWITDAGAVPLLENNPLIDVVLAEGTDSLARLQVETFDLVLNPDASPKSAALGSLARCRELRGYCLDERGVVRPANIDAIEWLEMGGRDDLKRANRRTYQDHLHVVCDIDPAGQEIILAVKNASRVKAARFARLNQIDGTVPVVGFNTGSSPRWPLKRWSAQSFLDLTDRLRKEGCRVLLLGGEREKERNRWLSERSGGWAVDTGGDHSLDEFFAHIDLCDAVVTGDTLALHAALGLKKRVVALFGPTSSWEIDFYGRGAAIVPDIDCVCCYSSECSLSPNCMDLIKPETVFDAVIDQLEAAGMRPRTGADEKENEGVENGVYR